MREVQGSARDQPHLVGRRHRLEGHAGGHGQARLFRGDGRAHRPGPVGEQGDLAVVLPEELFHADRYRGLVEDITDLTCDVKRIRIRLLGPATRWPSTARTGKRLFLTPLSLHMIVHRGFYQDRGSPYRLEPLELVRALGRAGQEQ